MISVDQIDQERLQKFFRHLCSAYKKTEESHIARQNIKEHIQNIKDISSNKETKVSEIHKELKELEEKVTLALDKQSKVIKHVYEEESFDQELLKKISSLEKQIGTYLKTQEKRAQRMKELESKIRRVTKKKPGKKRKKNPKCP